MGEVSHYINAPYEGVSEAPPQVALSGSCKAMTNAIAIIPQGAQKRPPFEFLANVLSGVLSPFAICHDLQDQSLVLVLNSESSATKAYLFSTTDWTSKALTVTAAAQTYLSTGAPSPKADLRVSTIEDTTFITNRKVVTALGSSTAPTRPFEAVIWSKTGGYAHKYQVTVSPSGGTPVTAWYQTAGGGSANDASGVGTDRIANGLYDGTIPHSPSPSSATASTDHLEDLTSQGFTVTLDGPVIYLTHPTVDFTLSVSDDEGGTMLVAIKDSVQTFSDLPAKASDGFTVRVANQAAGGNSDFYLAFDATNTTTTGVWKEVVAPGAPLGLDPLTMPIGLTVDDSGDWTLDTLPWTGRTTGDVHLSPDPDFIGFPIVDLSWFRGRLALLANDDLVLSASDSPFKFYTTTLTTAEESDSLGFLSPADRKALFRSLITFNKQLVALADRTQAYLETNDPSPTAKSAGLTQVGDSPFSDQALPFKSHTRVYYSSLRRTGGLVVYELSVDRLSGQQEPNILTAAIPTYVPSTTDRTLGVATEYEGLYGVSGSSRMVFHCYRFNEQQRVQNAFCEWYLPAGFAYVDGFVRDATAYILLVNISSGTGYWTLLEMAPGITDTGSLIRQYMDLRTVPTSAVAAGPDNTTFTVPRLTESGDLVSVRSGVSGWPEGFAPAIVARGTNTLTVAGVFASAADVFVGVPFSTRITPHQWHQPDAQDAPRHDGRLVIRHITADIAKFSRLDFEVNVKGRSTRTISFEGLFEDNPDSTLDTVPFLETVALKVPIGGRNTEVSVTFVNNSHLGFSLTGYEWKGSFSANAQRT